MNTTARVCGIVALLMMVGTVVGCTGTGDGSGEDNAALAEFYDQDVAWEKCGTEDRWECATYRVPLDYDDPDGETLDIAVKRLPSTDDDSERSLVLNPGGPGSSGYDYVDAGGRLVGGEIRERFDLVGFDPRGVGRSSPIRCLDREGLDAFLGDDPQSANGDADPTEVTAEGREELDASSREFVDACDTNSGALTRHMSTADVARDMDVLRRVLGDDGLTYMGKSYGISIGARYADQFPDKVRAMVLDGAIDPSEDQVTMTIEQATGFEKALRAFVEDCLSQSDCPLGGSGASVDSGVDRIGDLLEKAGEGPLDSDLDDGREVTRARVAMGLTAALYTEDQWPEVRSALTEGFDGDGTALLRLGDELYNRGTDGAYENSTAALVAVNCSDYPSPRGVGAYQKAASKAAKDAPTFGPSMVWDALPCAHWPEDAVTEPAKLDASGADPILVVGTTRDPATPYRWAKEVARRLESGVLLTREGDGHTGYRMGDACVDRAVETYLTKAEPPEDGRVCD